MRKPYMVLCLLGLFSTPALATEPMAPVSPGRSATKARDINGFRLGMSISEAAKRGTVTFTQGQLVQVEKDGLEYAFGVCPSGKIYRIEAKQLLGRFIVDADFTSSLSSRLVAKYGAMTDASPGNVGWDLIEPVSYSDGAIRPFKTNWFSVLVSSHPDGVTLDMTMIDFRVCWADKADQNRQPRDRAKAAVVF